MRLLPNIGRSTEPALTRLFILRSPVKSSRQPAGISPIVARKKIKILFRRVLDREWLPVFGRNSATAVTKVLQRCRRSWDIGAGQHATARQSLPSPPAGSF